MALKGGSLVELLLAIIAVLFGAVAYFTRKIMDDTSSLRKEMKPVIPAIVEIQSQLTEQGHVLMFPLTVAPGSPLQVTEFGEQLLRESGFYDMLEKYRAMLVRLVKQRKPKTNYDIQQQSQEVIQALLASNSSKVLCLKEYAFENGMKLEILTAPAGIVLRDEVMKELKF